MSKLRKLHLQTSLSLLLLGLGSLASAYEVPVADTDWDRQVCSGMWGGDKAHINVSFESASQGDVAMVMYEWRDAAYLGKSSSNDPFPVRTYICTQSALNSGLCNSTELGHFIFDLPPNKSLSDTTFLDAHVGFRSTNSTPDQEPMRASPWNNPGGNPTPPESEYDTPSFIGQQYAEQKVYMSLRQNSLDTNPSTSGDILWYDNPIKYEVRDTGYYCVAIIPLTVDAMSGTHYKGTIIFHNTFDGKLPATDYPKVNFYFAIFLAYSALGGAWAWLCYRHKEDLLPIHYYVSGLVGFLIVEMLASWAYYWYLNARGSDTTSAVFLFVVAILDTGRNALSFFLLLIVSLGFSVVRESLGRTILHCRTLTIAHFVFGVLYAVETIELELESPPALILLLHIIPLAFTQGGYMLWTMCFVIPLASTLSGGFMLWTIYALNGTISGLQTRKQHYKLTMFKRLYYILIGTITCMLVFFVILTLQFSDRLDEDYPAKTWKTWWWFQDGYPALLYLTVFWSIAYLWRPIEHNRR